MQIHHSFYISLLIFILLNPTTQLQNGGPALLYTTVKDVRFANMSNPRKSNIIFKDSGDGIVAVDFYYKGSRVCWTDRFLGTIQCVHYNGSQAREKVTVINEGLISPDGLACDWLTGKLYWTDGETNRVEVVTIDGEHRRVLFWDEIDQPRGIALAPLDGLMFWTDWGEVPKIERASMDGNISSRKVIVNENIFWPNDISIDHATKQIYWCDGKLKFIEVMDFDGRNRKAVISDKGIYPFALSIFIDKVYWTDFRTLSVHVADRKNGGGMKEMIHGDYIPLDLAVWDRSRQPSKQTPCDTNNGGCSHLCLLSTNSPGYSCACPTGVKLLNSTTCAPGVQELLLVVQRTDISRISLDSPDHTNYVIPLTKVKHAMNIDYDPVDGYFYWTDDEARGIRRAKLDGSGQEDIITAEVEHPDGVAIDWIARNLYWTDTGTDRIEVAKLSGSVRKVLINSDLVEPRAIAVAPVHGYLFWSDWNEKRPKIERTNLDGSARVILVKDAIGWPNGITLDLENNKLYWCDAKTDRIEVINMDGTNRREILSDLLPHTFGLSLLGDYLYWTDWQRRSIDRVHKVTGDNRQVIADQLPNIMGVKAVGPGQNSGWNPCKDNNGKCSHLCLNKPGNNYVCACVIGHELAADERTCVVPESFLLFSRKENIGRVSIENSGIDAIIPISGVKDVSALDFDISDSRIYWTDVKMKAITRAFINGSQVERIIEFGLHSPEGLAVDWVSHNIYWTDMGSKRIELARLNGSSRKVLLWRNINDPRSLALDPREGYMYWSDWDEGGTIERAGMDGSMQMTFLNKIGRAKGLTIDYVERKIYWTLFLQSSGAIESCDLNGNKRVTLVSNDIERPFALTLYKDHMYWTDWNKGTIERANKTTGLNRSIVHYHLEHITDLLVFHESRQNGSNQCAFNNGGCSHLCLARPKPQERACACPTHYQLKNNNCEAPTSFLMFSQKSAINRLILDTVDCPDVPLPIHGLKNVRAIEFDPVSMVVYWVDGRAQSIRWSELEGSNTGTLVGGGGGTQFVYDLALDPYNRLIYWSDQSADIINATWLDTGASLGTIVKFTENEKPRNIALHPERGYLFWTDVEGSGRVLRARMDGQKRLVIAADLPNLAALAVDRVENAVFFTYSNKIDRTDLNGNKRLTLVNGGISQVVSLVVSGNYIYWADKEQQLIERANKRNGEDKLIVMSRVYNLSDLLAVLTPTPQELRAHPCTHEKGERHCSHVCVVNNDRRECGCPPGLVLSDDKVCSALPACGADHFICGSPSPDCIPAAWRCDGQMDCPDESDELNCPECTPDQFRCTSGPCIGRDKVCDGIAQCSDGADEAHCCSLEVMNFLKFQCATTPHCIPMSTVCDGFRHCPDGSDETATACQSAAQQKPQDDPLNTSVILAISFLIILFIFVVFMIIFKLKKKYTEPAPISCDDSVAAPLSPKPIRNGNNTNSLRMTNLNPGSSSGHSDSLLRYPLNPPPSPSSTVQRNDYRSPRYRPPPPTPCSTDVCDESDSNYRENDPFPPPPTPRSHSSDPPSPSSSTYFPPPPSPINR